MKIYPINDSDGRMFAFEVENTLLPRRVVCSIVKSIDGAHLVRTPKWFSWFREDSFCEFVVEGELYEAWEPFGDNSRFWIGPKLSRWLPQTERVQEAFTNWKPWSYRHRNIKVA